MLIIETQARKLEVNGINLKHKIENTIFKSIHIWGPSTRLEDLSVIIPTKNDFLLLIEFLKHKTMVKTLRILGTCFMKFDIKDIKKVRT